MVEGGRETLEARALECSGMWDGGARNGSGEDKAVWQRGRGEACEWDRENGPGAYSDVCRELWIWETSWGKRQQDAPRQELHHTLGWGQGLGLGSEFPR